MLLQIPSELDSVGEPEKPRLVKNDSTTLHEEEITSDQNVMVPVVSIINNSISKPTASLEENRNSEEKYNLADEGLVRFLGNDWSCLFGEFDDSIDKFDDMVIGYLKNKGVRYATIEVCSNLT